MWSNKKLRLKAGKGSYRKRKGRREFRITCGTVVKEYPSWQAAKAAGWVRHD